MVDRREKEAPLRSLGSWWGNPIFYIIDSRISSNLPYYRPLSVSFLSYPTSNLGSHDIDNMVTRERKPHCEAPGGGTQASLHPTLTVTLWPSFLTLNKIHLQEYLSTIKSLHFDLSLLMRLDYLNGTICTKFWWGHCLTPLLSLVVPIIPWLSVLY